MNTQNLQRLKQEASALRQNGRIKDAIAVYREILKLDPKLADYWFDLGWMLRASGQFEAALEAYRSALTAKVSGPEEVHLNRAVIFSDDLRRPEDARGELAAALKLQPDYLPALLNLGNLLEEAGEAEDAAHHYHRLCKFAGGRRDDRARELAVEAKARLLQLEPPETPDAPKLAELLNAARDQRYGPETRANAGFAVGRALDRLGAYDDAFSAFTLANTAAAKTAPAYNPQRSEALMAAIRAKSATVELPAAENPPVFICGMFRSGSTLIEQVLSAHSDVVAGGEIDLIQRFVRRELAPFPTSLPGRSAAELAQVRDYYLEHTRRLFPATGKAGGVLTDKRPDNFMFIGLIQTFFPGAKIVHTVRHPLDIAISVYSQHLDQRQFAYSSSMSAIGHYLGQYRQLMEAWKARFPGQIFDFDYDAFVSDPEPVLRRLLDFLDLSWSDSLMRFHEQKSDVKTASYWQVRQPLYTSSSGRWRNYQAQLQPLATALKQAGYRNADL